MLLQESGVYWSCRRVASLFFSILGSGQGTREADTPDQIPGLTARTLVDVMFFFFSSEQAVTVSRRIHSVREQLILDLVQVVGERLCDDVDVAA